MELLGPQGTSQKSGDIEIVKRDWDECLFHRLVCNAVYEYLRMGYLLCSANYAQSPY